MTLQWKDMQDSATLAQRAEDVAHVRWLASEFDATELGEPYIKHPTFKVGPAAASALFLIVMLALVLCVVVVQVARHWLGLSELVVAAFSVYLLAVAGDWLFGRVAGWLR